MQAIPVQDSPLRSSLLGPIDEAYEELCRTDSGEPDLQRVYDVLYHKALPLVRHIAQRYAALDAVTEQEDFLQESFLGICTALECYRWNTGLKFSSFLYWYLQKAFQRLCPLRDRLVKIESDDQTVDIISYGQFQRIRRSLDAEAHWTVQSRFVSYEDGRWHGGKRNHLSGTEVND